MSYEQTCGLPGVDSDFSVCAGTPVPGPLQLQAEPAAPPPGTPPEPAQTTVPSFEPNTEDWADYHAWCREQDARDQDLRDARRELEYRDMLDAKLYSRRRSAFLPNETFNDPTHS